MPPPTAPSEVHFNEDLRQLFAALALARPDLNEALQIIAVALGLQSAHTARYNGAGQTVDAQWRQIR